MGIPSKTSDAVSDPDKDDEIIKKVPDGAGCEDVSGGWKYDDENSPTKIIACDQVCEYIKSITDKTFTIQLGCETVVL
jgi:hypothetical protein